jgi:hypothetical protein
MELNFSNITYLGVSGGIILSWVLQHVSKRKHIAKILSLPKYKQEEALKSLLKLIKIYKSQIFLWPVISVILGISIKISNPTAALQFYPTMLIMLLFYAYFVQGYFFQKKLFATLSQSISQNNP